MPPAARPSVSEKIRLIARPRPMASSTMPDRPIAEVEHDLLAQAHDVADPDDHPPVLDQVEHALVDALGVEPTQVPHPLGVESMADGVERHQGGPFAGEDRIVRVE